MKSRRRSSRCAFSSVSTASVRVSGLRVFMKGTPPSSPRRSSGKARRRLQCTRLSWGYARPSASVDLALFALLLLLGLLLALDSLGFLLAGSLRFAPLGRLRLALPLATRRTI